MSLSQSNPPSTPLDSGPNWAFEPDSRIEQPARGPNELASQLRAISTELGFAGIGFAPVDSFDEAERAFAAWIDASYHGTMGYLASSGPRHDPKCLAPGALTLLVVAMPTLHLAVRHPLPVFGQVARYAIGADYHDVLRQKLRALGQAIANSCQRTINARACVDTAPLLEREAARRAGLGFIGKSNLLILPGIGSHVLLGVLLVDVAITANSPEEQRCGRCTACLTACPTQAFVGPWVLDARRCISYLTIEYRGWVELSLRPLMGTHVFGCDICQDICPYNHGKAASVTSDSVAASNRAEMLDLRGWLTLTSSGYRRLTSGTALRRASRWQLQRNAAIAAGNSRDVSLLEPLAELLAASKYAIVRGHAAWALGQFANSNARIALELALAKESDEAVLAEVKNALAVCTG